MEKTGETANLGVAEDDCVVFVSQVETHQAIRAFFRPGTRSPLPRLRHRQGDAGASRAERVGRYRAQAGLEAFTASTLSDTVGAGRRPRAIRARGWSVDDEERYPGMRCIAAPIFNEFARADRRRLDLRTDGAGDARSAWTSSGR